MSTTASPRVSASTRETAMRLESLAARLLTWGTRIALGFVFVGVVGLLVTGVDPITTAIP